MAEGQWRRDKFIGKEKQAVYEIISKRNIEGINLMKMKDVKVGDHN